MNIDLMDMDLECVRKDYQMLLIVRKKLEVPTARNLYTYLMNVLDPFFIEWNSIMCAENN